MNMVFSRLAGSRMLGDRVSVFIFLIPINQNESPGSVGLSNYFLNKSLWVPVLVRINTSSSSDTR